MSISHRVRGASHAETAREMDRRGEVIEQLEAELADMSDEQQAEFEARTKAQSELRRAAAEITRLRAEVEQIASSAGREIFRLREALDGIRQYGADTLSGRADGGPDDRNWQRDAVREMTRRARAARGPAE